jgi:hypothetical protein
MMTIPEFREPVDRHFRRVRWYLRVFLVLSVCLLVVIQFGNPDEGVSARLPDSAPRWLVSILPIAILVAFSYLAAWLLVVWANRNPRLRCPRCDKGLVRHHFRVVATRCCPRCVSEILTDPKPQHPAALARAEVEVVAHRHRRRGLVVLLGLFALPLLTIGVCFEAFWLMEAGWIGEPFSIAIACLSAAVPFGWAVWGLIQCARMFREKVVCPRCQAGLFPEQIAKSGGCGWCGQRMIADPPDAMQDGNGR